MKVKMGKLFKKKDKIVDEDIGFIEDCFEVLKDMTAYEGHSLGSYISTKDKKNLNDFNWMREMRTHFLSIISKNCVGQDYCRLKHLARIAMGLQELGSRYLSMGMVKDAQKCADYHEEVYLKFLELIKFDENNMEVKSSA